MALRGMNKHGAPDPLLAAGAGEEEDEGDGEEEVDNKEKDVTCESCIYMKRVITHGVLFCVNSEKN